MKRTITLFCCLSGLLVCAGMLQLLLAVFPGGESGYAEAATVSGGTVLHAVNEKVSATKDEIARRERHEIAELLKSETIICDNAPLTYDQFLDVLNEKRDYSGNVTHLDQRGLLPSGCEIVALTVAMRSEGYDADPIEIADRFLLKGTHRTTEYIGSPASDGGGFPPCIVAAGNAWLSDRHEAALVHDLSGSSYEGVKRMVQSGFPVVVWVTEKLQDPVFSGPIEDGVQWYLPEHVVVLYGFDGGEVLVSDSLEGLVRLDESRFASVYEACGRRALFVAPTD